MVPLRLTICTGKGHEVAGRAQGLCKEITVPVLSSVTGVTLLIEKGSPGEVGGGAEK